MRSSDGRGYFLVAKDGGVFAFGDAHFLGSLPGKRIATSVAAVTPTNGGRGYYVVGTNGRVYAFGAATPARQLEGAGLSLAGAVAIVGYRPLASCGAFGAAGTLTAQWSTASGLRPVVYGQWSRQWSF